MTTAAWECRDQADLAEEYYNHPLRVRNKQLQDENIALKRLLRENNIGWNNPYERVSEPASPDSSASDSSDSSSSLLPIVPTEIIVKIMAFALTSPNSIIDPLCKIKKESLTTEEKDRGNQIAIHFLATCKAFNVEGKKFLWTNNTFTFTTVQAVKTFADVDLAYRETVKTVNLRIIARYYDDEDEVHHLTVDHHPQMSDSVKLKVNKRPKEHNLARRGFRVYGWLQVVDFLEALLPPHDPSHDPTLPPKKLLPNLDTLRIDLVNFGDDLFHPPPGPLHDVASHLLGSTLNELIVTGLPHDDAGFRTGSELSGLLKDDGLFIDHAPTLLAIKNGLCVLQGNLMHMKVVRSMRPAGGVKHHHHDDHPRYFEEFAPAPPDTGNPPYSPYFSCRTIWKKTPHHIDRPQRKWVLFDRVSGLQWSDVEEEATMFDDLSDGEDEEGMVCENCLEIHPGAILADEVMDELYDM